MHYLIFHGETRLLPMALSKRPGGRASSRAVDVVQHLRCRRFLGIVDAASAKNGSRGRDPSRSRPRVFTSRPLSTTKGGRACLRAVDVVQQLRCRRFLGIADAAPAKNGSRGRDPSREFSRLKSKAGRKLALAPGCIFHPPPLRI